jgi:hypothetical protein
MAGDEVNPEIEDDTGEGNGAGGQFRDIDAAWFSEDNDTVIISLKMAGSPPGLMDLANQQDTTVYEYEVYFDVEGTSYAVAAIVQYAAYIGEGTPLGGVYSTHSSWGWELREINYALGTNIINSEASTGDVSDEDYDPNTVTLMWEVSKESIGIGEGIDGRGQELTNTWAAVWNADPSSGTPADAQRDPQTQSEDYAHTHHSDPGKSYRIRGFAGIDYNIVLSTDDNDKEAFGGTPTEFLVKVQNNGTHNFQVSFFTTAPLEGWTIVVDPNATTVTKTSSKTISVSVTPPKKVANGTVMTFRLEGNINEVEGNGTVPISPALELMVTGLASSGGEDEGNLLEDLINAITENIIIVGGSILVVIIAIIILAILIRR